MDMASIALMAASAAAKISAQGPVARFLIVLACLVSLSGCESLELIAAKIANRSETQSAPRPAATASTDAPSQSLEPRVAVLDPDDFRQASGRHLQALIRSSVAPLALDEVGFYMDVQNAQLVQILHPTRIDIGYEGDLIILTMPGGDSFEHNSTRLKDAAIESLNLTSRILLEYSQTRITIHGHTDDSGEATYNQLLSVRRALSVANHLITAGIASERIAVVGFGESRPLAFNAAAADHARNRRIELYLEPIAR